MYSIPEGGKTNATRQVHFYQRLMIKGLWEHLVSVDKQANEMENSLMKEIFNDRAKESFEDKVLRMVKTDAEKMNRQSA